VSCAFLRAPVSQITVDDMTGGTFITNGGVLEVCCLLNINPPQSAILGMHNIIERPIAVNGSGNSSMMYVALSYDHRIIDGKESVFSCYQRSIRKPYGVIVR
jgi:2-oxoglutarate dehydrogenase E2 component (dihydrolipoamide succinyltransferase)